MYFEISKKSEYAILALIELSLRGPNMPLNARKLAFQNNLPVRFLEVILNELKKGGFVLSVRGKTGGYVLARSAHEITLAKILNFIETRTSEPSDSSESQMPGQFVVESLVQQANSSLAEIFERCTLSEMARREMEYRSNFVTNYVI